jgi:stearoyl-CoA desaturase (delta-9 desaturase)
MSRLFPLWVFLGLLIPAVLGGLLTLSWMGVLLGFIWGGLARVFLVHHVTWSINSVCHIWGSRPFNHHAFPSSARYGLRWYQIDFGYQIIKIMERVGLATDVRTPSPDRMAAKRMA